VTKDEIIEAMRGSALSPQDFQDILSALIETMMGNAFVGLGMDLTAGQQTSTGVMGHWVPAPMCKFPYAAHSAEGWRGHGDAHEHWVAS
jgi:hypothetical protein